MLEDIKGGENLKSDGRSHDILVSLPYADPKGGTPRMRCSLVLDIQDETERVGRKGTKL